MQTNASALSPADITTHLRAAHYPADREALLRCARDARAPEAVLMILGKIPDQIYGGVAEVTEKLEGALARSGKRPQEDLVEKESEDSFPASDAPSHAGSSRIGTPPDGEKGD